MWHLFSARQGLMYSFSWLESLTNDHSAWKVGGEILIVHVIVGNFDGVNLYLEIILRQWELL